jgi:quercetin dioxygenase-like cupin family protein
MGWRLHSQGWVLARMVSATVHCQLPAMSPLADAFVLAPGAGERIRTEATGPLTFKLRGEQSNGRLTVLENVVPSSAGPPLHVHAHEDECWYVLAGELRFQLGERFGRAAAGSFVFIPRGTPHTFQNVGAGDARVLVLFTPAGMERLFERLAAGARNLPAGEAFARVGREVGMRVVGPALPDYRDE